MSKLMTKVTAFLTRKDEGATLVEYGLLVGLIACACIVAVTALGGQISTLFTDIKTSLAKVTVP